MLGFLVLNKRKGREGWCHYVTTTLSGVLVQIHSNHTRTTHSSRTKTQKEKRGAHVMVVASRVERAAPSFATS